MEPDTPIKDKISQQPATGGNTVSDFSVLESAQSLWYELHELAHHHLQLAVLETQQAGESLVIMLTAGMIVAGLLLSSWLGLIGAAVLVLIDFGVAPLNALFLAVAVNLLVALLLCGTIRRRSYHLRFPANTRSVQPALPESLNMEAS